MSTCSRSRPADVSRYSLPLPVGDGHRSITPARSRWLRRRTSSEREMPGRPAGDVVEPGVAEDQLAHDQRRPAVGDHVARPSRSGSSGCSRTSADRRARRPRARKSHVGPARFRSWTGTRGPRRRTVGAMTMQMETNTPRADGAGRTGRPASDRCCASTPPPRPRRHLGRRVATRPSAQAGMLTLAVPSELGGMGAIDRRDRRSSTASSPATAARPPSPLSMHHHVTAFTAWRWRRGLPGAEATLQAGRRRRDRARVDRRRRLHPPRGARPSRSTAATGSAGASSSPASRPSAP